MWPYSCSLIECNGYKNPFGLIFFSFITFLSGGANADSSKQFETLVLERMPGFQLTQKWNGRPISVSPAYTIEVKNGNLARPKVTSPVSKEAVLGDLVGHHEKTGLPAVRIYSWSGSLARVEHWRIDFPGCSPGKCLEQVGASKFVRVSKEEALRYHARQNRVYSERVTDIVSASIGGVRFQALTRVYYDFRGRVTRYTVEGYKDISNAQERRWARRQGFQVGPLPVPVFYYANNLVLSVDGIIYFGRSHGLDPGDLRLKGL